MRTYAVRDFDDGLDFGAVIEPMARQAPTDAIMTMDATELASIINNPKARFLFIFCMLN